MTNCTNVMECNYNITRVLDATNNNIVVDPASWLYIFDTVAGGYIMVTFLAVICFVAFILMRTETQDELQSLMYATFMTTVIGIFLFLIPLSIAGAKLIAWASIIPFFVIFLISTFLQKANIDY